MTDYEWAAPGNPKVVPRALWRSCVKVSSGNYVQKEPCRSFCFFLCVSVFFALWEMGLRLKERGF